MSIVAEGDVTFFPMLHVCRTFVLQVAGVVSHLCYYITGTGLKPNSCKLEMSELTPDLPRDEEITKGLTKGL